MAQTGLTVREENTFTIMFNEINVSVDGPAAKKHRKNIFHPKQKLAVIRFWFNSLAPIQLTNDELQIIKKIIVKSKGSQWNIIREIIKYQKSFSGKDVEEWFSYIKPMDRNSVAMTFIMDNRVKDNEFKLELTKGLLDHVNYRRDVMTVLDRELSNDENGIWKEIFYLIVDMLQVGDATAEILADLWANETTFLNLYAYHRDIASTLLYEYTGLEQYLSQEAKDIFLF